MIMLMHGPVWLRSVVVGCVERHVNAVSIVWTAVFEKDKNFVPAHISKRL